MGNEQGVREFWELGTRSDEQFFWQLSTRSDEQILGGVRNLLGTERHVTARVLAHLNEVAERRLHLKQAHSSMFEYCLELGMSEDEAGRRLCAAGVAKRFPRIYALVDSGRLSLSVVCKLKHYLSEANQAQLLTGVSGLSFRKAEAWLATRFPRPDVPSTVRKLPTPTPTRSMLGTQPSPVTPPVTQSSLATPAAIETGSGMRAASSQDPQPTPETVGEETVTVEAVTSATVRTQPVIESMPTKPPYPRRRDRGIIEPLSSARYRIQFTASESVKEKLELACDLMAHRNPTGDLGPIVEKALDLLLDQLKKQRFGQTERPATNRPATSRPATDRPATDRPATDRLATKGPVESPRAATARPTTNRSTTNRPAQSRPTKPERITNATRREVIERDGLRCSFTDERGTRCKARAFLELDHRKPRGKGGTSDAANVRCFCRAHNKLLAELEYGREHIERAIAKRRASTSNGSALIRGGGFVE